MSLTIFPKPNKVEETGGNFAVTYPLTVALPEALASLEEVMAEALRCQAVVADDGILTFTEDAGL